MRWATAWRSKAYITGIRVKPHSVAISQKRASPTSCSQRFWVSSTTPAAARQSRSKAMLTAASKTMRGCILRPPEYVPENEMRRWPPWYGDVPKRATRDCDWDAGEAQN